jgi:hypothetical protein
VAGWKKLLKKLPFGILEVGRVGLLEFGHSSSLPDYLRNTLLGILACFSQPTQNRISSLNRVKGLKLLIRFPSARSAKVSRIVSAEVRLP